MTSYRVLLAGFAILFRLVNNNNARGCLPSLSPIWGRLTLILFSALSACAGPAPAPVAIDKTIGSELDKIAAAKQKSSAEVAKVQESLLPPLSAPPAPAAAKVLEPRFDLSVNNAPAQQVFLSIVSGTRYSMLVHPEVSGGISVNLKDVTVLDALDAIRDLYGYDYRLDGTRITVLPITIQTRVYRVNYLIGQRQGRSDVRVTSGSVGDSPGISSQIPGLPGATGVPGMPTAMPTTPGVPGTPGAAGMAGVTDSSRVQTSTKSDFWDELTKTLEQVVGKTPGRSVVVNPQAGVVVVRALPNELRQVQTYLDAIRDSVQRQVMLEAKIIEVTLNEQYQAGVNWALFFNWAAFSKYGRGSVGVINPGTTLPTNGALSGGGLSVTPTLGAAAMSTTAQAGSLISGVTGGALLGLAFQTPNFAALLQFLETQGSVQVLSSPRIATMNNQKAVLKVGTDEFFLTNITGSTTTTTSLAGNAVPSFPTLTLRPFFSGVALDITPQIDEDSSIILHVHPSVSLVQQDNRDIDLGTAFGGRVQLPLARSTVSETDSVVKATDGNIVAIGGLMKVDVADSESGLPGTLGSSVGKALGSRQKTVLKKELVILIKPTVVQSEAEARDELRQTRDRMLGMGAAAVRN